MAVHISLAGIAKDYAGVAALRDIDLDVERGSVHALVGENGAGKSTLGKIISGATASDRGTIAVAGEQVTFHTPRDAQALRITRIAQEITLVPLRSVLENVFLGAERRRLGQVAVREMLRRYEELVEVAGFSLAPHAKVADLRLADQQKVEILRALARDVELVVMDEPTAALNREEAARLAAIVRRLREQGRTVVYVSHFLSEVLELADTVTILKDGALVQTVPALGETPATLVQAMLGRALENPTGGPPAPPQDAPVVLRVSGLRRGPLVRDASLELRRGEILGLAGLVGSGRTELLRCIFGADRAEAGTIEVDGEPVRIRKPRDAIAAGIALLPESRKDEGLVLGRPIRENVTLTDAGASRRWGLLSRAKERERVRGALHEVSASTKRLEEPVSALSGGNQQKTLFAKWLIRQPRVLLADEPTRGVDVGARRSIYDLILGLAEGGMAVLLVSSDFEEVIALSHRVLVVRDGALADELVGDAITEEAIMASVFPNRLATTPGA